MRAIGFRVKSGYAIAIVIDGTAKSPAAVARRVVELCDPSVEETRQPYHSGFGEAEEDGQKIARLIALIERAAARSIAELLESHPAQRAGLVVGSVIDPAKVGNQHIRAHASEGRLFRTVLEGALALHGVTTATVVEKNLAESARGALKRTEADIRRTLAAFGKALGAPWRTDEKAAATAGWMMLV